jgi:hypothetical protein
VQRWNGYIPESLPFQALLKSLLYGVLIVNKEQIRIGLSNWGKVKGTWYTLIIG